MPTWWYVVVVLWFSGVLLIWRCVVCRHAGIPLCDVMPVCRPATMRVCQYDWVYGVMVCYRYVMMSCGRYAVMMLRCYGGMQICHRVVMSACRYVVPMFVLT